MRGEPYSQKQLRKFHAMIRDIASQVPFAGDLISPEEWKLLIFAAAYGQDVVPNPFDENRFVVYNKRRTRDLDMPTLAQLITQLEAFGAEKGVEWRDPFFVAMRKAEVEEAKRMGWPT